MISGATMGNVTWTSLTGQSAAPVSVAKPQDLQAAAKRSDLDTSHLPDDAAEMTDADRLALAERENNKKLKSYFAAGTVFDNTIRMLGGLGNFWGMINGVMGSGMSGWTSVWAGAGSALTVSDASFAVKMAAVNRNLPAAIDGTLTMVQGMGVMVSAMGFGRIPALVAAGCAIGKMVHGMYRASKVEKEKEELKKADEARREAEKAAKQQAQQPNGQPAAGAPSTPPATSTPAPSTPGLTASTIGGIALRSLTGQAVVTPGDANPRDVKQAEQDAKFASMTEEERRAAAEKRANEHIPGFYAAGTVFDTAIRAVGAAGTFWGMVSGIIGGGPVGMAAVWAGAGSALTTTDAASQVKSAAVNRNLPAAIDGSFGMVQGMGVMLTAMGLGKIPALVSAGALAGRMGYRLYRAIEAEREKEEQKKAPAQQQPPVQPAPPAAATTPTP